LNSFRLRSRAIATDSSSTGGYATIPGLVGSSAIADESSAVNDGASIRVARIPRLGVAAVAAMRSAVPANGGAGESPASITCLIATRLIDDTKALVNNPAAIGVARVARLGVATVSTLGRLVRLVASGGRSSLNEGSCEDEEREEGGTHVDDSTMWQ